MNANAPRDITRPSPVPRGAAHACSPAVPGLRLCHACLARTRQNLRALPPLYDDCADAMNPAPLGYVRERVSGSREARTVNETALEARMRIKVVFVSWARLVTDERRLTARGDHVGNLARFLTVHLHWLAAHHGAADFVTELDELVSYALHVIDAGPAVPIELGACIEPGCGGLLVAPAPGLGAGRPEVRCDSGRHSWRPDQWLLLRRRLDLAGRA
jgi:hypothetical protein